MEAIVTRPKRLYVDNLGYREKGIRALWKIVRVPFFAALPGPLFRYWRLFVLRCFGAKIGKGCRVEASCVVWWPGHLIMGNYACLAQGVDCYNVAPISIGDYATVSQRAFLCSASHRTEVLALPLIYSPIKIEPYAWVCAEAFVGPGVCVARGAVLAARAVAVRDLKAWTINVGNPAREIKPRKIRE
jgi:putative colanic acid biosynthesis acetyltransferase WcaF